MSTYSEVPVSKQSGELPYTVPAGKYARVTIYANAGVGGIDFTYSNASAASGGTVTVLQSGGGGTAFVPLTIQMDTGDTINTSPSASGNGWYVALEFTNP